MAVNSESGVPGGPERDPGLTRLYGAAAREEPSARLDAAIRAAARREVGARPRALGARLRAWRMPVSIAAVIVLSVSVVTLMREEGADRLPGAPSAAPALPRPELPARIAVPATAPSAQEDQARAPLVSRDSAEAKDRGDPKAAAADPAPARRVEPAAAPPQPFAAPRPVEQREAAPAGEPASVTVPRGDRESAPPAPARPSAPVAARVPAEAPRARSEIGVRPSEGPAPPEIRKTAPSTASETPIVAAERVLEGGRPPWHGYERERPEKWLERILELRRQGQMQQANEMLGEFKRRFSGHPLPAELR